MDRLTARLAELARALAALREEADATAAIMERPAPTQLDALEELVALAERLAGAPALEAEALGAGVWDAQLAEIDALLDTGTRLAERRAATAPLFKPEAWAAEARDIREALAALPADSPQALFDTVAALANLYH